MPVPTKYYWNTSFQKKCSSKYVVKNTRNVTQFVLQPFSIEFQGFVKNIYIYIHQNLRYYETIEQIHFMVVKKIESYVWEKNSNIWSSLIPPPLLLRLQKNNQNQTNTTGAQNLNDFNNSTGWLSVFYGGFFL